MSLEKQTVVILHGWGLSGVSTEPLARELRLKKYRVLAPDLPGFGKTRLSRPYSLSDYVSFLSDYIKMNVKSTPILVGHSFGGRIVVKYAFMYPKNVRALILSGTPGFSSSNAIKIKIARMIAKVGNSLFPGNNPGSTGERIRAWFYYMVGARDYYRANTATRQTFKKIVSESLVPYLAGIYSKTLLLWGSDDELVPVSVAQKMKEATGNAQLVVIPLCGHNVLFDQTKKSAEVIDTFIQQSI